MNDRLVSVYGSQQAQPQEFSGRGPERQERDRPFENGREAQGSSGPRVDPRQRLLREPRCGGPPSPVERETAGPCEFQGERVSAAPFNDGFTLLQGGAQRLENGESISSGEVREFHLQYPSPGEVLCAYVSQSFTGKKKDLCGAERRVTSQDFAENGAGLANRAVSVIDDEKGGCQCQSFPEQRQGEVLSSFRRTLEVVGEGGPPRAREKTREVEDQVIARRVRG